MGNICFFSNKNNDISSFCLDSISDNEECNEDSLENLKKLFLMSKRDVIEVKLLFYC